MSSIKVNRAKINTPIKSGEFAIMSSSKEELTVRVEGHPFTVKWEEVEYVKDIFDKKYYPTKTKKI